MTGRSRAGYFCAECHDNFDDCGLVHSYQIYCACDGCGKFGLSWWCATKLELNWRNPITGELEEALVAEETVIAYHKAREEALLLPPSPPKEEKKVLRVRIVDAKD